MFGGYYDRQNDINQNFIGDNEINMDIEVNSMNQPMNMFNQQPTTPIIEPLQEKVVHRTIVHEVPHICPQRTKIINHHVYKHTYTPSYSCCEENTSCNVQCGSCCQFGK